MLPKLHGVKFPASILQVHSTFFNVYFYDDHG